MQVTPPLIAVLEVVRPLLAYFFSRSSLKEKKKEVSYKEREKEWKVTEQWKSWEDVKEG